MSLLADFALSSVLMLCKYLGVLLKRKRGEDSCFYVSEIHFVTSLYIMIFLLHKTQVSLVQELDG